MEFFKLLETLSYEEKQAIRHRLIKACMIEPPTWYTWMNRKSIPRPAQKLIALELEKDMSELFPKTKELQNN
jgi:hypothetical protein